MTTPLSQFSDFTGTIPPAHRLNTLYAPFKLKILFGEGEYGLLGRGSVRIMPRLRMYKIATPPAPLFEVGNYCDTAQCDILIGGEHYNDHIFNYTLTDLEKIAKQPQEHDFLVTHARRTTRIGSNVTIGLEAKILSGVTIGNGAVIGAGAVVTKDVPPFAIAAGNPARVVKFRFSEEDINTLLDLRWWDLDPAFLFANLDAFADPSAEKIADTLKERSGGTLPYDDSNARLVLQCMNMQDNRPVSAGVAGVERDGALLPANRLPAPFQQFIAQLQAPAEQPLHLLWQLENLLEPMKEAS